MQTTALARFRSPDRPVIRPRQVTHRTFVTREPARPRRQLAEVLGLECAHIGANLQGRFYAADDACTHGESSLSEVGELNGDVIECGRHFGGFHVPSGKPVLPPCSVALRIYPVVELDGVFGEIG